MLIRKPSACVMTENMQKMQSSSNSRRLMVGQMWVVTAILLLTTIIFTVNAEQAHFEGSEVDRRLPSSHVIVDGFEVSLKFVVLYLLFATKFILVGIFTTISFVTLHLAFVQILLSGVSI